jgi:hypothetical protein
MLRILYMGLFMTLMFHLNGLEQCVADEHSQTEITTSWHDGTLVSITWIPDTSHWDADGCYYVIQLSDGSLWNTPRLKGQKFQMDDWQTDDHIVVAKQFYPRENWICVNLTVQSACPVFAYQAD